MMARAGGKVVIAGATGFVGGEVTRLFNRLGYETVVISRTKKVNTSKTPNLLFSAKNQQFPHVKTWQELEVDGLPSNTVAVINCCGQNVLDPFKRWNDSFKTAVYDSRVKTNQALARAISSSPDPVPCFVHMSGVGYYPPDTGNGDHGYTEASAGGSHDWLATLVKDWEAAAQVPGSTGTRVVSLRSGVVLGRRGGMIQQTLIPFLFGVGGRIGSGQQTMPWIHVKDVAGLIAHCVANDKCSGVYNAVSPQLVNNSQFTKAFASALNRPAWFPVPGFVMQLIFGTDRANMILQSQTVIPKRALESGYQYRFSDIDSACEEFAHWDYLDQDELPNSQ